MKRCTRLDLDSEMEKFIKIGKDLRLEGDKLLQIAERKEAEVAKKEAEAIERKERNKERGLRKLQIEAENKRLEDDKEKQRVEAERKRIDLEAVEAEKRRAHELEIKRLKLSVAAPGTPEESRSDQSARAPKLPAFNENTDKMDAYLERFERFAKNNNLNKWQEDVWATRLNALLTGKSLEFYWSKLRSSGGRDRFQWVMDLFYPLRAWCCQTRNKRMCQFAKVAKGTHLSECCETRDAAASWPKRILSRRTTS